MKWARDFVRTHYQPMAARPDAVYTPPWDLPPEPAPVDLGAFDALAADFVPSPNQSEGQARRWRHADLAGLGEQELWRERERAAFCAAWLPPSDGRTWAETRLRAVASEEARHGR